MSTTQNTQPPPPPAAVPKKFQEETVAKVLEKVNAFKDNGEIRLPDNYVPGNALRSAWLILQDTVDKDKRPVLEVCTQASIANALLEMVIKGLSPVKKQCYFVAYGNELCLDEGYFGDQVIAKRVGNVKEFKGYAVYEGDQFEYERNEVTGRTKILGHKSSIENQDPDKVAGAYVIVLFNDGSSDAEVMSMKQIQRAWAQGQSKGQSPAHRNFADEMAIKTVIGRACKKIINSTDDADLFRQEVGSEDRPALQASKQIEQGANKLTIGMNNPAPKKIDLVGRTPEVVQPATVDVNETAQGPDEPPY